MEKKMENEIETGIIWGLLGYWVAVKELKLNYHIMGI